jgi:2-iminobutanoate/2-iminopropanoate deaminase
MADFAAVNAVYKSYFSEPYPARSTVAVVALPMGARVEIEMIASRRAQ